MVDSRREHVQAGGCLGFAQGAVVAVQVVNRRLRGRGRGRSARAEQLGLAEPRRVGEDPPTYRRSPRTGDENSASFD